MLNGRKHARGERAVLIAGPTASGKSALALALAERHRGVVVNADSMQVYRDLRIITARPTPEDEARAPHRLYGHVDAAATYSVGHWINDVARVLDEAAAGGELPILVGGTGLYFKALTRGLAAVPPIPPQIRAAVRARLAAKGASALHAELARHDPEGAAALKIGDGVRIVRALEVIEATGRPLAAWHRDSMAPLVDPARAIKIFLSPDRSELKARIGARFDAMMAAGALDEVRALDARGLAPWQPVLKAHGVPWLRRALVGEMPLAEAVEGGKRDTWRYTKRQFTWFRHQLPDFAWVAPADAARIVSEGLKPVVA
ncbi:MAG TPA: tRNA (adenosine(37)-N6)-dimethylallyltransferase MiaA [Xanthobacteraceae bacterium]|jgi:tRNA dimethylallyltransferase|nr:tRNA (adenosine(37)-N6)-dimethylallyltransferase MiaA [Xanthobacteraceae bacterium]